MALAHKFQIFGITISFHFESGAHRLKSAHKAQIQKLITVIKHYNNGRVGDIMGAVGRIIAGYSKQAIFELVFDQKATKSWLMSYVLI